MRVSQALSNVSSPKFFNYQLIGTQRFSGVDFSGTFYIHDDKDDDFAGFVFSLQDSSNFYALMWKKDKQTYWYETPFKSVGKPGIQLKAVSSKTGPGEYMRNALWDHKSIPSQVERVELLVILNIQNIQKAYIETDHLAENKNRSYRKRTSNKE